MVLDIIIAVSSLAVSIVQAFIAGAPLLQGLYRKLLLKFQGISGQQDLQFVDRTRLQSSIEAILRTDRQLRAECQLKYLGPPPGAKKGWYKAGLSDWE